AARAGGEHHLAQPAAHQLVGEDGGERGRRVHADGGHLPPGTGPPRCSAAAATRARHGAGSICHAANRSAEKTARRTGSMPPTSASGWSVTSPASRLIVASP